LNGGSPEELILVAVSLILRALNDNARILDPSRSALSLINLTDGQE